MHNRTTTQGEMWDIISVAEYETEYAMRDISDVNVDYADALILSGEIKLVVPDKENISVQPVKMLPPWERY